MWYLFGCMMVMVVLTESEWQCNGVASFSLSKGEGREKSTILVNSHYEPQEQCYLISTSVQIFTHWCIPS